MENLFGAKSLDKAIEVQSEYAKTAYEGYVTHARRLGELYINLATEAFKPYEGSRRRIRLDPIIYRDARHVPSDRRFYLRSFFDPDLLKK